MIRSPFFETEAEAWAWLHERPSVMMSSQRIYQTRKLGRWRATWHEMSNEPIFSRDAIALINWVPPTQSVESLDTVGDT